MNKIKQNYEEVLELVFKISYLCLAFATFITYIYMSPLQPILVKVTLVLGLLTIFVRMINWKKYGKMPCLILMILFCISFLLSTVMNRQYGMTDNLKWLIWTGIQFLGLYVCDLDRDEKKYKREFAIISHIFILATTIAAIASLIMLAKSYSEFLMTADNEFIITGFKWDRLWGVYTDPNYGAVCSVLGIILSGLYMIKTKGVIKIAYGFTAVFNLAYLIFSDSRTGILALILCGGLFVFLWGVNKFNAKKYLKGLVLVICVFTALLAVGQVVKTQNIVYQKKVVAEQAKKKAAQQIKKKNQMTVRQKNIQDDASNGRLAIWQSAVEVWKSSPIYGTGYSTVVSYTKEHVPDTYIVNNSQGDYTSMHNTFFCAMVFQGSIGIILLVMIAVRIFLYVIKDVFVETKAGRYDNIAMFCCTGCVAISMMFLMDGIYTNSASAAVLWIFSGYLVSNSYRKRNGEIEK